MQKKGKEKKGNKKGKKTNEVLYVDELNIIKKINNLLKKI